ncbi:MAG: hypothetical protein ACYDBQ_03605 [Thermoplasmatota archaeon]
MSLASDGLPFDAARTGAFLARVPTLYASEQGRVNEAYQRLLYTIEHPLAEATTDAIEQAFALGRPAWNAGGRQNAIQLLDRLRFPATATIGTLTAIAGLDLTVLSHYLHFFHHAYPIYTRESCRGLERLGVAIPYVKVRDPDVYGLYIQALEHLKEAIPYWDVPETNVYLTRIVQAALHAYGREAA